MISTNLLVLGSFFFQKDNHISRLEKCWDLLFLVQKLFILFWAKLMLFFVHASFQRGIPCLVFPSMACDISMLRLKEEKENIEVHVQQQQETRKYPKKISMELEFKFQFRLHRFINEYSQLIIWSLLPGSYLVEISLSNIYDGASAVQFHLLATAAIKWLCSISPKCLVVSLLKLQQLIELFTWITYTRTVLYSFVTIYSTVQAGDAR